MVGGGTLAYAKYDPEFRKLLADYAPFTDTLIKFVFQEERSIWSSITRTVDDWKDSVTHLVGGESKKAQKAIKEVPVDYKREWWKPFAIRTFKTFNNFQILILKLQKP